MIQLNGTDTYPEFYAFLTEVYYKAIKEKAQDSLNNLSPIVISVPSSQNTIEQDFKFLVNSNECFKKLSSHNEILTPSFLLLEIYLRRVVL